MHVSIRLTCLFGCLLLHGMAVQAERYTIPLLVSPTTTGAPVGVVRILNGTDESGTVEIYAIGNAGTRTGPATFTLNASAAAQFTTSDLQSGNASLGLTGGIGTEVGDARLEIETDLSIVPLAFVRAADGTLSAMHDTVRRASADGSDGYTYEVPVFNPSSDVTQVSRLRLINPGDAAAAVTISGRDDSGAAATDGDVTLTLAVGGAQTLTAQQLEAGDAAITGRLGAGTGRWRLTVTSDHPLQVINIVAAAAGYWNNLSTTAAPGAAPADLESLDARFLGNAVVFVSRTELYTLNAQSGERFTETAEIDGVTTTSLGSYDYARTGPDEGRLTLRYDDGDECTSSLYFSTRTRGGFVSRCTGSEYPAEGIWLGGHWFVESEEDDGGGSVDTAYGVDDVLPGIPTSGVFYPAALSVSGATVTATGSGTTITLSNGGYFELADGTRYTCTSADGCTVTNGTVTRGSLTRRAAGAGEVDRFPRFRDASGPREQIYTVDTAIDTLTLPEASGGNGTLTYRLSPSVPGLTFDASTRQLAGIPSAADTYDMTYTVTDEDGDTDSIAFNITVRAGAATEGSLGVCQVGMLLRSGQSCTYPNTADEFSVNERDRGSFLGRLAGIRIRINNETIDGRVYDFEASHLGDGVWRINRISSNVSGFSDEKVVTTDADGAFSVYASDLDGDGDPDVLSASVGDDKIAWYQNLGDGKFSNELVISNSADGAFSVYASDLDGDGDPDVLSASYLDDKIAWYQNLGDGKFSNELVISNSADGARSVYASDLDGDGDPDVLSASAYNDKIAWYQNLGDGKFSNELVISNSADGAFSVYASDLDGDGDPDVLSASAYDDKIAWYQNLGDGKLSNELVISNSADGARTVHASDLDGDGDLDVLSASFRDDKIAWYQNLGDGKFSNELVISNSADGAFSVYASDLDGDGDPDVLSASAYDDKIAWYENLGGGDFSDELVISIVADNAYSVHASDLDGDGDLDVLSASYFDDKIAWYENLEAGGGGSGIHVAVDIPDIALRGAIEAALGKVQGETITTDEMAGLRRLAAGSTGIVDLNGLEHAVNLVQIDLSGNAIGDISALAGLTRLQVIDLSGNDIVTLSALEGLTALLELRLDDNAIVDISPLIGNFGLDDDDLVSLSGNPLSEESLSAHVSALRTRGVWVGGGVRVLIGTAETNFSVQRVISKTAELAVSVHASDLDGDGEPDVLSASLVDNKIAWYKNLGGGKFSDELVISTSADGARSVHASDLDGDGDPDVLSASGADDKIAWYENFGGGDFSDDMVISTSADGAHSVYASDLDGDGDSDVLSASFADDKIAWYENLGGGDFSGELVISTAADGAQSVYASDLDGDGDPDVLSASSADDKIAWYENLGGGDFSDELVISTAADGAQSVYASDLDDDGDPDVLSASFTDDKIAWYENLGGGDFSDELVISTAADGARSVHASDLDGDGDLDVLSASADDKIAWYKNLGGGDFSDELVISTAVDSPWSVRASDLDGDGDPDVLSASLVDNKIAWHENLGLGGNVLFDEFPESPLVHLYNDNVIVMRVNEDLATTDFLGALATYATEFYHWFEDEFDYLMFFTNLTQNEPRDYTHYGRYYSVMNDTAGLGWPEFFKPSYGSAGRLRGVIHLIYPDYLYRGPALHELQHAWSNWAIPTARPSHWGYSSAYGQLGGFDSANLVNLGGGRWTAGRFGTIINHVPYSPIELYFAGLAAPEEVPELWVAEDGEWLLDENGNPVVDDNGHYVFTAANPRTYSIEDIIAEHGERRPAGSEVRRDQRAAIILVTDFTRRADVRTLQLLSEHATAFALQGDDGIDSSNNYYEATLGRGTLTLDGLTGLLKDEPGAPANLPAAFGVAPPPVHHHDHRGDLRFP